MYLNTTKKVCTSNPRSDSCTKEKPEINLVICKGLYMAVFISAYFPS